VDGKEFVTLAAPVKLSGNELLIEALVADRVLPPDMHGNRLRFPRAVLERTAAKWKGAPVALGHPSPMVSAADRFGLTSTPVVGSIESAQLVNGVLTMKGNADRDRIVAAGHDPDDLPEVSIGAITKSTPAGEHRDVDDIVHADHVALVESGKAACSPEMGCRVVSMCSEIGCDCNSNEEETQMDEKTTEAVKGLIAEAMKPVLAGLEALKPPENDGDDDGKGKDPDPNTVSLSKEQMAKFQAERKRHNAEMESRKERAITACQDTALYTHEQVALMRKQPHENIALLEMLAAAHASNGVYTPPQGLHITGQDGYGSMPNALSRPTKED